MIVLGHAFISVTVGGILYSYSHSIAGFLWFSIAGIFIDIDHYIDYIREHGITFNLKEVYNYCKDNYTGFKKLTLIFHSYELSILLWSAILLFNLDIVWRYIAVSFTLHILLDQMINPVLPLTYFLLFRIANNFETKKLFVDRRKDYAYKYR